MDNPKPTPSPVVFLGGEKYIRSQSGRWLLVFHRRGSTVRNQHGTTVYKEITAYMQDRCDREYSKTEEQKQLTELNVRDAFWLRLTTCLARQHLATGNEALKDLVEILDPLRIAMRTKAA